MSLLITNPPSSVQRSQRDVLIKGQPAKVECAEIAGQVYTVSAGPLRAIGLEDEWYEDVRDPEQVIKEFQRKSLNADLFTFFQRIPETEPRYSYHHEWESIAVLPITTYENWWNLQVARSARNKIRKSQKAGVEVRVCRYDDAFVRGMTEIFNETPTRQGRRFWHYGKDVETVREQFARYLFREELIGAFLGGELVGFVMVANAGGFAAINQIISKVQHRDKAVTNALVAKTVELCAAKHLPYLAYALWESSSLSEFKRQSGFQEMRLPRYFVPLSVKGRAALKLGLHRGWRALLPQPLAGKLRNWRKSWYERRAR